jgi:protoheme ferro-lyase
MYDAFDDYSPHNDLILDHIANLELDVEGANIDRHVAFLDAVPRIHDVAPEIAAAGYDKVVVVPLLLASSTHTQEVEEQVEEALETMGDIDVVVAEPFFEVPFMRDRIKDAVLSMAREVRATMPADVADEDVGVVLVSHGTPYTPAHEAFGWQEGDIYSNLVLTEDLFHEEVAAELPWPSRTGRMNYASPSIEDALTALEEQGLSHVMILPTAFPTVAAHTMWHVAEPAVGRPVTPDEGMVVHERDSGMHVYHSALGYADFEEGAELFRDGLAFIAEVGVYQALQTEMSDHS